MCTCPGSGYALAVTAMSLVAGRASVDRETGIVTWLGVRWYGVPMPARVWIWIRQRPELGREAWRPGDFDGCGCAVRVKGWLSRGAASA